MLITRNEVFDNYFGAIMSGRRCFLQIPLTKPSQSRDQIEYVSDVFKSGDLCGGGKYGALCEDWLRNKTSAHSAFLTQSGTAALELAALALQIKPGDEVIMPSYTFSSTANAFALRGAKIVFVDILEKTLNIDPREVEKNINKKTKAIVLVHYAGVSCDMDSLQKLSMRYQVPLIEDAAQALLSEFKGRPLGTFGKFGCISFHATKNVQCGEGGALLVSDEHHAKIAEIMREKGTDRSQFIRGEVDKYTWKDLGSSYIPSEITAAMLLSNLEEAEKLTKQRIGVWDHYYKSFSKLEEMSMLRRPHIPAFCKHNAHIFYILLKDIGTRSNFMRYMSRRGISCPFHYIPLHTAPAVQKIMHKSDVLPVTDELSGRLVRLPIYSDLSYKDQNRVIEEVFSFFGLSA